MTGEKLQKLIGGKYFLPVLSFLIALCIWIYVVVFVNTQHTVTINNVPVNMQYKQSVYQSMGLDVVDGGNMTVDVTITGSRSTTADITADDILVYPNITNIEGSGTYTFTLTAEKVSGFKNFEISSLSRDTVTVRLDKLINKDFTVTADISSVVVAADCMADMPTVNPGTVNISGPEYKINSIAKVVAVTSENTTVSRSTVLTGLIKLYDENDAEIDKSLLTLSFETADVTVPVMKEVTLPIKVEYVNVPEGFNTDVLHQSLSVSELKLAVPAQYAASLSEFVVGYIDLSTLETDKPYEFAVTLPTGYRSMDDVKKVIATISGANLTEKNVNVSEIKIINDPDGKIEVLTSVINNVVLVGEPDAIENLSVGGVIAQIDAARLSLAQGQQSVSANFIIPSTDRVFVKGSYTVSIRA